MKKLIYLLIVVLVITSVGCNRQPDPYKDAEILEDVSGIPTTNDMKLVEVKEEENVDATGNSYVVEGKSIDIFIEEYKELFEKEDWEVVEFNRPGFLRVKKDNEQLTVVANEFSNKIVVNVIIDKVEE